MLLELKIAIVILAGLIAAYTDYKTGYIYDWLNWSFIVLGAIFAFFSPNVLWTFGQFAIVLGIGYIFYKVGKIGGGDIKFFAGLALFFPFFNGLPFILVVLILSSILALIFYGIYYTIMLLKKPTKDVIYFLLIAFVIAFLMGLAFILYSYWYLGIIIFIVGFFGFTSVFFKDLIMQRFYRKEIVINKLLDDDLIDMKQLSDKYSKVKTISTIEMFPLDNKSFNKLKQLLPKSAKVTVYRNLPIFGPFIALGIIASFIILTYFNMTLLL